MAGKYHWEEKYGQYRAPTAGELADAVAIQEERVVLNKIIADATARLSEIQTNTSRVFYDEAGYLYDIRHFIASGKRDLI